MAVTEAFNGSSVTVSTTEISLTGGTSTLQSQATAGVYQLFLDTTNMTPTESYMIRVYEKVLTGGSKRKVFTTVISGAQDDVNYVTPALMLMWGWEFTLTKVQGTDRTFDWSIRKA